MGEIIIGVGIKDGRVATKMRNIKATSDDIAKSIAVLEMLKQEEVKLFKKLTVVDES